jgi:hypothetical protein
MDFSSVGGFIEFTWESAQSWPIQFVITGLDPVIQVCGVPHDRNLDCRVKPGNDGKSGGSF